MPAPAPSEPSDLPGDLGSASDPTPPGVAGSSRSVRVLLHVTSPSVRPDDLLEMSRDATPGSQTRIFFNNRKEYPALILKQTTAIYYKACSSSSANTMIKLSKR